MKLFRTIDELEISGSIRELAEIQRSLENANDAYNRTFTFDNSGSPEPYEFLEAQLKVCISSGAACATFSDNEGVKISGNLESLRVLASFFNFELDAVPGEHNHWDEACDSSYFASGSLPLVVSVS
ncbi:hypothetical protein PRUB_a0650 [Pseudoalteromonas rubra]|uniref:Uncharacterized protein n=1 Tax=Pseudoalteromonas rubra TaxID=43658 RepID=A0A8T0C7Y1_9GAMM|nr:hypothetical protein [Pseudoalteromonas rubra]KAF7786172.1 hypothetical protein PRUB_a0650 [Pseudoalteromonas rubra]